MAPADARAEGANARTGTNATEYSERKQENGPTRGAVRRVRENRKGPGGGTLPATDGRGGRRLPSATGAYDHGGQVVGSEVPLPTT